MQQYEVTKKKRCRCTNLVGRCRHLYVTAHVSAEQILDDAGEYYVKCGPVQVQFSLHFYHTYWLICLLLRVILLLLPLH